MADHHVGELEHDFAGEVVASDEEFGRSVGEDELHGGGTTAVGDGNG